MHARTLHPEDIEPDMARALETFRRRIQETWHTDQDLEALAGALPELLGGASAVVCEYDAEGRCVRTAGTLRVDDAGAQLGRALRALPPDVLVREADLDLRVRRALGAACDVLPGAGRALAITLHHDGAPLLGLCVLRTRPFDHRDLAALDAATVAIRELRAARHALDRRPLGATAVSLLLDAHPAPAFLVAGEAVLYANPEARRRGWSRPPAAAAARTLAIGASMTLVLAEASRRAPLAWDLPPWLARVAELAAQGLSDKEIAAALDMSHATVRTAVSRVLQRLGVTWLRDLMLGRS
jgi:hypothetical protein